MLNIFKKNQVPQTKEDSAELALLKETVRWAESARIFGDITQEEFDNFMTWVDFRLGLMEKRYQ